MEQQDSSGKWKVIDGTWDHNSKKPGRWTGRVILTGQGLSGSKLRGGGQGKRRPAGYYQEDVKRITTRDPRFKKYFVYEESMGVIRRAAAAGQGETTSRNDQYAIDIKDVDGSEERLSEIIREVSQEILKAANTNGADATITTAQLFKGLEAHTIVIGEAFQNAFDEEREAFKRVGKKSPQMREMLNTVYVALTRAEKQIDIGERIAKLYFNRDSRRRAIDHINDEIAKLRKSGKPEDLTLADALEIPQNHFYGIDDDDPRRPGLPTPTSRSDDDDTRVNEEADNAEIEVDNAELEEDENIVPNKDNDDDDGEPTVDEDNIAGKDDEQNEDETSYVNSGRVSSGRENNIVAVLGNRPRRGVLSREAQKIWDTNFPEQLNKIIKNNNKNDVLSLYSDTTKSEISKIYRGKNRSSTFSENPDLGLDPDHEETEFDFFNVNQKDFEKANKLINRVGKVSNVVWALKNSNDKNSSPKTQLAAKKILNDARYDRLSSGRADRRVIKSLDDVKQNMKYDHSRAADYKMTDEQINISDAVMTGDNIVVRALAGTGKTSTLLSTAKRLLDQEPDKRIVYLTFTRKMAEEARKKFKDYPNVEVRTWDSVGFGIIGTNEKLARKTNSQNPGIIGVGNNEDVANHYGFQDDFEQIQVKNKQGDLVPETVGLTRRQRAALMARAATEFSTGKNQKTNRPYTEMNKSLIGIAASKMGINRLSDRQIEELVRQAQKFWNDSFDENSPLEMSRSYILKKWSLTNPDLGTGAGMKKNVDGNDIIFFDEAQDANPVMTDVIRNQKIQWIAVGDSNQAIYEFRGAVDELEDLEAPYQLTLTKTFRFGKEIQAIANRFLKAHETKLTNEEDETPIFAKLRIDAAGPEGIILDSEEMFPKGIAVSATRETKKNGSKETLAFLSQTNAKSFERIINEQDNGRKTGSTTTFKNDLTGMIDHMEWLQGGKKTEKPKNVFPPLWSVKNWDELAKAAGPLGEGGATELGGGAPEESVENVDVSQQALTAYRLFAKYNFNWSKMRQHVANIQTLDGGDVISRKITAADLLDEFEPVEIVDGGVLSASWNPRTKQIVLKNEGGDWGQFTAYKDLLIKGKYKFTWGDPAGKYGRKTEQPGWHLEVPNVDAAASTLNNLAKDIEIGIPGGDSPEFSSLQTFSPIVEGSGSIPNYLSGAKYIDDKRNTKTVNSEITLRFKRADGKFVAVADGNTFQVKNVLKGQDPKTKKSTFAWSSKDKPQFGEPNKWVTSADTIEELYEKLENLRKVNNLSGGSSFLLQPTPLQGAAKNSVDIVAQTAHRSKGLEFDNVILAGDFKAPKWEELAEELIVKMQKDGRVISKEDIGSLKEFLELLTPKEREEFKKKIIKSMGAEEIRLQYVAATRAMRRLVPGSLSWIFDVTDNEDEEFKKVDISKPKTPTRRAERRNRNTQEGDDRVSSGRDRDESEIDPDYPIATEEERRQNEYEMGLDNEVDERIREGDKKSRRQIEKEINQRDVDAGDEQAKVKQRQIIDRDKRLQSSEIDPDYPIATEEERRQNEYEMGLDNEVDERIREGDKKSRRQIEKEINQRDVDAGDEQAKVKQRQIIDRDKRLQSGADQTTEEGRLARRNRKNNNIDDSGDGRISSGRDTVSARIVEKMHGFSADNDENESARRAWERIKEKGWLIDPSGVTGEGIDKKKIESTSIGMANIGSRIAARNRKIKIGDISKNNPDSANQETWMLPVEKLKKMIRIPTKWDPETGDVIERRELSSAELGTMLNLTISESRKLNSPNAGLSFNDVMYLIAEIGNEPRFDSWRLFSPTTLDESGVSESDYMQRAIDNLGRAKLRERFVLETFGKDAFPMYIGRNEKNRISQSEYEKMDSDKRFEYGGIFKDDGSSEDANTELMYEGMRSDSPIPFTQNINKTNTTTPISPVSSNAKTMRAEFRLSELLAALGISGEETIAEKDKKLNSFLSRSSIGEQSRKTIGRWEAMGVPTSVISEMIKSGIIKDAASVFKNTDVGRRLDMELSRPKYSVYEALLNFIKETQGSSPKNTRKTVSDILDATDAYNYLPQIAKAKGSMPYSANVGDIPRYSDSELQQIVNRFNNIFGTQHTIDDIFSDEQIRQARERIEKDGIHTPIGKPNVRTKLKNENNE
jgi:superfamily I DNA/RNA helicase